MHYRKWRFVKIPFPVSFLLYHSFEEYSGCYIDNASTLEGGYIDGLKGFGGITVNNWHSFTDQHHEIHYFNYNLQAKQRDQHF